MRSSEAKARFRDARQLYTDRQFEQCLDILNELSESFFDYPDLHYLRARCLGKLKRADELRAVAALLTDRFQDSRGAEILSWFVPRLGPPDGGSDENTHSAPVAAAVEPAQPVEPTDPSMGMPLADSIEIDWGEVTPPEKPFQSESDALGEDSDREPVSPGESGERIGESALTFGSMIEVPTGTVSSESFPDVSPPDRNAAEVEPELELPADDYPIDVPEIPEIADERSGAEPSGLHRDPGADERSEPPTGIAASENWECDVADLSHPEFPATDWEAAEIPDADTDATSPAQYLNDAEAATDDVAGIPDAVFHTPLEDAPGPAEPPAQPEPSSDMRPATDGAAKVPASDPQASTPRKLGRRASVAVLLVASVVVAGLLMVFADLRIPAFQEPSRNIEAARAMAAPEPRPDRPETVESEQALAPLSPLPIEPSSAEKNPPNEIEEVPPAFDLSGRALHFAPDASGGYVLEPIRDETSVPLGAERHISVASRHSPIRAWKLELPFKFNFGGVEWDTAFVNQNGSVTFGYAESDVWSERDPGSAFDGRAMAATIDSRSAAGRERLIAPLMHGIDPDVTRVYVDQGDSAVSISWVTGPGRERANAADFGVVLHDNGAIEFSYGLREPLAGVAGIFPGITWAGELLAEVTDPEDARDPNVDIVKFTAKNALSVVECTFTMRAVIPMTVSSGELIHRVTLDTAAGPRQFGVTVTNEPRAWMDWGPEPRTIGYERDVNKLYLYVSKSLIADLSDVNAHAEVVWKGYDNLADRADPLLVPLTGATVRSGETDFSESSGIVLGNVFEIFD